MSLSTFIPNKNEPNKKRAQIEKKLFGQIQHFNQSKAINHALLKDIVDACESYISTVSFKERKNFYDLNFIDKFLFRTKYPNIEIILKVQKEAVRASFLPEEKSIAKSRWSLLRNLLNPDAPPKTINPGMRVQPYYWPEFRYKGNWETCLWIDSHKNKHLNSYSEMLSTPINKDHDIINILYANEEQQKKFKTSFNKDGLLVNAKGKLVDTSKTKLMGRHPGMSLYVYTSTGLFIFPKDTEKKYQRIIKHSSLLSGRPVLCAGMFKAKNGKIIEISNLSGHYQPTKKAFFDFIKAIEDKADLSEANIMYFPWREESTASVGVERIEYKRRV